MLPGVPPVEVVRPRSAVFAIKIALFSSASVPAEQKAPTQDITNNQEAKEIRVPVGIHFKYTINILT